MAQATDTLDANGEAISIAVRPGQRASYSVAITGTATVTLNRAFNGGSAITCKLPDGDTDAVWTSGNADGEIVTPGLYALTASSVSGGSAVCKLWGYHR